MRFVNGSPVFEYPMLNLIYDPGPTALTLTPPWNTKYKFSKAGNLLALWESRWRRADGMSGSRRSELGYNIPSDKGFRTALNGHWQERGLAKKLDPLDDKSWIMFDIELKQWFPEKKDGEQIIDRGHLMSCVEHHMMMKQMLGDDGARDETAERRRKQYVHTFMHDLYNYVPQLKARNRGAPKDGTYDGDYSDFRVGGDGITVLPGGETLARRHRHRSARRLARSASSPNALSRGLRRRFGGWPVRARVGAEARGSPARTGHLRGDAGLLADSGR